MTTLETRNATLADLAELLADQQAMKVDMVASPDEAWNLEASAVRAMELAASV